MNPDNINLDNIKEFYTAKIESEFEQSVYNAKTNINSLSQEDFFNSWYVKQYSTKIILKKEYSVAKELVTARAIASCERGKGKYLYRLGYILHARRTDKYTIAVEWKNSRTWGSNPHGEIHGENYSTAKASGCGYDKLSTVTADLLNNQNYLRLLLLNLAMKETHANRTYGYYYTNSIPSFAGGVGFDCHKELLNKMGYDVSHISGKTFDAISIIRRES